MRSHAVHQPWMVKSTLRCFDFLIRIALQVTQTGSVVYKVALFPPTRFSFFISTSETETLNNSSHQSSQVFSDKLASYAIANTEALSCHYTICEYFSSHPGLTRKASPRFTLVDSIAACGRAILEPCLRLFWPTRSPLSFSYQRPLTHD